MRIAVCLSGALRDAEQTIVENLGKLTRAGHEVVVFSVLQAGTASVRISMDTPKIKFFGTWRPWINVYKTTDSYGVGVPREFGVGGLWNNTFENRTLTEILSQHSLVDSYLNALKCKIGLGPFGLIPFKVFPPHLKNSTLMLEGIFLADRARINSLIPFDYVLRLRPDFALSDIFVSRLALNGSVQMPVRNSGLCWDYGWGYASDMVFGGSPEHVKVLSEAILDLDMYWAKENFIITKSKTLPFLYGDSIFSKRAFDKKIPIEPISDAGDLVRPLTYKVHVFDREFIRLRIERKKYRRYILKSLVWQYGGFLRYFATHYLKH